MTRFILLFHFWSFWTCSQVRRDPWRPIPTRSWMDFSPNDFEPTVENVVARVEHLFPDIQTNILNLYLWGSRVYGLATPESDWDFQLVHTDEAPIAVV